MSVDFAPMRAAANAPRANWSNVNARAIIEVVKPGADLLDDLEPEAVAPALRRVVRALNVEGERAHGVFEGYTEGRCTMGGSTDEQVRRRLTEAAEVLRFASRHGIGVFWG